MALAPCKCGCGIKVESSIAYKTKINGASFTFLNEEHYNKWLDKSQTKKGHLSDPKIIEINDILVSILHTDPGLKTILSKELPKWEEEFPYQMIKNYMTEYKNHITEAIKDKEFTTIFGEVRYIWAVIKKALPGYIKATKTQLIENNDIVSENANGGKSRKRLSLAELEDDDE